MSVGAGADDPSISDDAVLWRRVYPGWVVFDENENCYRISTAAFDNSRDGHPMSVYLADLAGNPSVVMAGFEGYSLSGFSAGVARACGQAVARDPLPDAPAHALVIGPKTRAVKKQLARAAFWVVPPPQR